MDYASSQPDPWMIILPLRKATTEDIAHRLRLMPRGSMFTYADADRRVYVNGVIDHVAIEGTTATVFFLERTDIEQGRALNDMQEKMPFTISLAEYGSQDLGATTGTLKIFRDLDHASPLFTFSRSYGWSGPSD